MLITKTISVKESRVALRVMREKTRGTKNLSKFALSLGSEFSRHPRGLGF